MERKITFILLSMLGMVFIFGYPKFKEEKTIPIATNMSAHEVNLSNENDKSYINYEYYCTNQTDTSSYYFNVHNGRNNFYNMYILYNRHLMPSRVGPMSDEELEEYSSKVRKGKSCIKYHNSTLDDIMKELDMCINLCRHTIKLDSITEIVFGLQDLLDCSVEINKNFIDIHPKMTASSYYLHQFYIDVEKAIYKSGLKKKINVVLNKYGMNADTIKFDDENHFFMSKKEFMFEYNIKRKDIPARIICGIATCKCGTRQQSKIEE